MEEGALIVEDFGAFLGRHSERLRVSVKGELKAEAALINLRQVLVTGRGVSISADAIEVCCGNGIPIHFVSFRGEPYAALYAAGLGGTVLTRRAQMMAYHNERGLALALGFARGKITNQAQLLKYVAKYRKETAPELYQELRLCADEVLDHLDELERLARTASERSADPSPTTDAGALALGEGVSAEEQAVSSWEDGVQPLQTGVARIDDVRFQLLSIEGRAAQKYWGALKQMLPPELNWPGREGRGAQDAFNAALNYGYGILYGQVERALVLAGLDPFAGFVHVDRPGKPSLTLDFIEEFRAPIVDRTVLGLVNKGVALAQEEDGLLTQATRRVLADKVLERLEESTERYEKKKQPLRFIVQSQARHLATFVRGERATYEPFITSW